MSRGNILKLSILVLFGVAITVFINRNDSFNDKAEAIDFKTLATKNIPNTVSKSNIKDLQKKLTSKQIDDKFSNNDSEKKEQGQQGQKLTKNSNKSSGLEQMYSNPENLKWLQEYNKIKQNFISKNFKKGSEWNQAFQRDEGSEWGLKAEDDFRKRIYENAKWDKRPTKLDEVECKTHFCRLTFSFNEDSNNTVRHSFFPDLMSKDNPNKMRKYSVYYDEETKKQHIYMERCMSCE